MESTIVFLTLFLILLLFLWGRIRHDIVALIALSILVITGSVPAETAFSGFGHPAVITVAAVLVIGKALEFSGLIDVIANQVMKMGDNLLVQITLLSVIVAVASAFINNVAALAIMMPIAIHIAKKSGNSLSYILMPVAFASILGGMTTLIGTPSNIIIATFRADTGGDTFGMFDFFPVGSVLTLTGILFVSLIGWRLLPKRAIPKSDEELFNIDDYITEVRVEEDSPAAGKTLNELTDTYEADFQILGLVRNNMHTHAPRPTEVIRTGDIIILETDTDNLKSLIEEAKLELVGKEDFLKDVEGVKEIVNTEAVVGTNSLLVGQTASDMSMRRRYSLNLLAVARQNTRIRARLGKVRFRAGDVLLLQGYDSTIGDSIQAMGCLPLAHRELRIGSPKKITLALGIFTASIALVMTNLLPVQMAFTIAAVCMVMTGVLPGRQVYTSIDWPIIVLLGAMIPVGQALDSSGGSSMIASRILGMGSDLPAWAMVGIILVVTMFLSDIINNAATVVLMAPIAISVANGLGASVDPFLMAVAIGGSCAFLTPIGHQSNTLVMGPGGYKFSDYSRMGIPLEILIILLGVPLILYFWPV